MIFEFTSGLVKNKITSNNICQLAEPYISLANLSK